MVVGILKRLQKQNKSHISQHYVFWGFFEIEKIPDQDFKKSLFDSKIG